MDVTDAYSTPALQAGTLTFLLTDVEGSTRRWQEEPERMRAAVQDHDRLLQEILRQHGGAVLTERGEGDSFFAVFARASDAVAAALQTQLALRGSELRVRMAIHTGEAGPDYRGPDVNSCARLRGAAHGGQVLVSASAQALAHGHLPNGARLVDLGRHRLKDLQEPLQVFQLEHDELPAEFPPLSSLDAHHHNLPLQLSSFVGREQEVTEVVGLLEKHRLVTLTGAGGSGKTRLALQVAGEAVDTSRDGAWFVDLSPLAADEQVPGAIGAALALREQHGSSPIDAVGERLAQRRLLLVLDNCEHLLAGSAAAAAALLSAAPGLTVLATSREPLRVPGEVTWRVPTLNETEAAELFRARSTGGVEPWEEAADRVADICRRLDGVPLAIELAARRSGTLGIAELQRRLDDRFRLLTSGSRTALPRQQTLRAAIDWSHDLLAPDERALFRRLGVFPGSFDLDAAEAVAPELSVLDLLPVLVEKSLVTTRPGEDSSLRYQLLESLRAYALEHLEAAGELPDARRRHLDHYADLGERAYREGRMGSGAWAARIEIEHGNLGAALDFALRHSPERHLALAGAVSAFWKGTGHHAEGRRHLQAALGTSGSMNRYRARVLSVAGLLALWHSDHDDARRFLQEALTFWRQDDDRVELAICLDRLAWMHFMQNQEETAAELFEEELRLGRELADDRLVARGEGGTAQVAVALQDVERARPIAQRYLELGRRLRDAEALHFGYHFLGDCALLEGDCRAARSNYRESLVAAVEIYDPIEASFEIEGLAMAAAGLGQPARALHLAGAVAALRERLGTEVHVRFWDALLVRYLGRARSELSIEEGEAAWRKGAAMSFEQAVEDALTTTVE